MDFITGERFQLLCGTQISIKDFMPYEAKSDKLIDAYTFDFTNYENDNFVYINNDLIKGPIKPEDLSEESRKTLVFDKEVDIFDKLSNFPNPFTLILHNNDSSFGAEELKYFDIPNCKRIFAQNVTTKDERVIPIPIGIGNACWPYGYLDGFKEIDPHVKKTKEVYFNFTIEGGCRDVKRPDCFNRGKELGIEWLKDTDFTSYLKNLNNYKFILSPEGNGIDCHRTWEALYLKTIPIVDKNPTMEFFSKYFPMVLVEDWKNFNLEQLEGVYESADWSNYSLLNFKEYIKHFKIL